MLISKPQVKRHKWDNLGIIFQISAGKQGYGDFLELLHGGSAKRSEKHMFLWTTWKYYPIIDLVILSYPQMSC